LGASTIGRGLDCNYPEAPSIFPWKIKIIEASENVKLFAHLRRVFSEELPCKKMVAQGKEMVYL